MLHYYGDWVRRFFLTGGIIMLVTLPYFKDVIPFPILMAPLAIVILILIAAFTNPESKPIAIINVIVSAAAVVLFEYYAVGALSLEWNQTVQLFFWANHLLALDFILALYFSAKTLRGMIQG